MSVKVPIETSKNLFRFPQTGVGSETNRTLIFEEITNKLEEYLLRGSDDIDSTYGIFNFVTTLSDQIRGEFEELLDSNSDKKRFLRALLKILALLLNTKVNAAEKKKMLKITIETTLKI